jgi:ABC-type transporter Mla MlaB component
MTIVIADEQTVRNAEDLRQRLLDAITPNTSIDIDVSGITDADLSFVQLLLSARHHADAIGAHLQLTASAPQKVLDVLDLAGFAKAPFWVQGAQDA